jgi:hypothetical protein
MFWWYKKKVLPALIESPSLRTTRPTVEPFTRVPFFEPLSSSTQ